MYTGAFQNVTPEQVFAARRRLLFLFTFSTSSWN